MKIFGKVETNIDSKKEFFLKIEKKLLESADGKVPDQTLQELCEHLTEELYDSYKHFRKKYPKSKLKYSKLRIEDLDNPYYQYRIYDFLRDKNDLYFVTYTRQLLNLSKKDFNEFRKRKNQFENM
ncbi:hypothetical protein [Allomuricauda sp. NBRC 101325]|uniref:hypothetical protein n=1 Tax=Allomuricauda sp. NBRC 101325 TaxID=1113758 RepID=UPI0024A4EEBB|nr:hypothetical protein [Muricauda sp. NBRC 101325]GLU44851.1 hypothetical protein Musp01_24750 [Muricauda sp. NBRC 101325]